MERVQGKVGGFGRVGNTRVSGLDWLVLGNNTWVKGCFYFKPTCGRGYVCVWVCA